jgi:signal transduction histidine kinase
MEAVARLAKTTMRRSRGVAVLLAAGAVVLLGSALGRARRAREARRGGRPVPLAEVVAAAVHANPDASRVDLAVVGDLLVPWRAAADLAHLLAELVDNAVAFSAPETRVRVGGRKAGPGYVVEVEDRGLGMTDRELAVVNRRLAGDPAAGQPSHRAAPRAARSPEQVRVMLTRYRSGLERGRVAGARDLPDDPLP